MSERAALLVRARRLEVFTIVWNVLEAVVSIGAGFLAGSIALVGFGSDSVIETASAVVVYRRVRTELEDGAVAAEASERRAVRFIGITFLVLAAGIGFESVRTLRAADRPDESVAGIVIAALSLIVMPLLAWRKRRVGIRLGSRALVADAKETFVCAYLSLTLLLGLVLTALAGWWWADAVAALAMVPFVLHEGIESLRGDDDDG
jgi:divalent metal cation (Fe/Co/Zn/Cd) transporter